MIRLNDVSKLYRMGEEEIRALDHADLVVNKGEFVSIIGPSGSGKSTLMNIVGCLDTVDEGEYLLDGQDVRDFSDKELAGIRNQKVGFIFQDFNLLPQLTAAENVELPLIYQKISAAKRREMVESVLEQVDLGHRMDHRPFELSGGQQQRVAIARALVTSPSLFLADEPTGALDSKTGEEILELFHQLHAQGNTILVITHDERVASQAQRKIRILDGRVHEEGKANGTPGGEAIATPAAREGTGTSAALVAQEVGEASATPATREGTATPAAPASPAASEVSA